MSPDLYRPVEVDRTSPVPLYFQVASRLQELIERGEIGVGARIENEVDLAERLGVSRPTTRRAIQYLVERGMLVRKRGVGTQVVHPRSAARWNCPACTTTWSARAANRAPRSSTCG
nr:hypothetical protein GCM10020092_048590 [Actinoplanes digitatis]